MPDGVVSTGWPAVRNKCRELGVSFRPWQHGAGQVILSKRDGGKYAATIGGTGMSIPRQVGKTFLVGAIVFALCLLRPGLTVIWTAHRLRTAEETFGKMQAFAMRKRIAPHIAKLVLGSGEEEVRFVNGSRILFGARERGFGRGFDEVDVLIFDEAQILGESALDDMVPATNQSRQATGALLLFMGTPPKPTDPGDVFRRMRTEALSGEDTDTGWIEFGADSDFEPTPIPAALTAADWAQVAKANPSYPQDTPREAILRMRKNLGPDSFLREGLGRWDDGAGIAAINFDLWQKLGDAKAERGAPVFGVAVAPDRSWSAVAAAWRRPDGRMQVALTEGGYRPDATWVAAHLAKLQERAGGGAPVLVDAAARGLISGATEPPQGEQAQADNALADAVLAATIRHGDDPAVDTAVRNARWKTSGDTRVLDRKGAKDISPLRAIALAAWGVSKSEANDMMSSVW